MTRKMAWIGSFYLIGLFAASFLEWQINTAAAAVLLLFAVSAAVVYRNRHIKAIVCVVSAAAGMFLYGAYDLAVYRDAVKYNGCEVDVRGRVVSIDDYSGDKASYTVKGVINGDAAAEVICYADGSSAEVGDIVSFAGKAKVPSDTYTFPAKSYYKAKGIYLQINNVNYFSYISGGFSLRKVINSYREHLLGVIAENMDAECASVMTAMLFGDKSGMDSSEKTLMYRAGIGHIMAVSGVHLSVVCSFFWFILRRMPFNKYVRFGFLIVPIVCFVLLAGMSNSIIRAAVMVILVYGADLFRRKADTFNSLGIAVIILTVTSPFAVRDASFLLSAAGVFGIGVAAPAYIEEAEKKRRMGKLAKAFISSLCVMVVVFPVTLLFFDEVSVISPLSNIILLPVCEIVLIGGIIVTLTGGAGFIAVPVLKICEICCRAVIFISGFIGSLRFSYVPLGSDYVRYVAVIAVCTSALSFVLYSKRSCAVNFSLCVLAAAIAASNVYRVVPDGKITVAVLKNKTAVTAVVHDRNSACIIDLNKGGGAAGSVVKYLNKNGIYKLDAIILNTDANVSLPVYLGYSVLFDEKMLLVPSQDSALTDAYSGDNLLFYDKNNGSAEMDGYKITFMNDGVILISSRGSEIIMYGSDSEISGDNFYSAAVRYSGKKRDSDPDAVIIAAMSDGAEVASESKNSVYIGENVKIVINSDGKVTSEELD